MASWWILQICLVTVQLIYRGLGQADPCKIYKPLYDDGGRSIKCSLYHIDSHDRFIDEGWRRVQWESTGEDLTMPTRCIKPGYCGSHSNVWLNGTHPTVEDGIVDRMGCLSMFSSCCHVQYPIQIKNCTDYMVYNLKKTLGSDERYCFGDRDDCFIRTTVPPRPPHYGYRWGQRPNETFGKQKDEPKNPSKRAKNLSKKRKELEKVRKQITRLTDRLIELYTKENRLATKIQELEETREN